MSLHRLAEIRNGRIADMVTRRLGWVYLTCTVLMGFSQAELALAEVSRPNILWITAEDMSAQLGCYGDKYASTPNLDALANQSVRYTRAFATAPVCSPARSCLITGVYATSLGTQRLRSKFPVPEFIRGFPAYLRDAGYFTTNNVKTDYNIANEQRMIQDSWDRCSDEAHWRQRSAGEPFFSVFNLMTTHQSRSNVWSEAKFEREIASQLSQSERHDPKLAPVPPYYPDTPIVRETLARYYDCITVLDKQVGQILDQLKADGLVENTIVFFFSDHGMGLPRGKRLLHDSGMHVPLMVRIPAKYRHLAPTAASNVITRLVSFVDFPPTVLQLAQVDVPDYMQGNAFLNGRATRSPGSDYVFGARDRVDEAYDLSRSVRGPRYLYIRNYMPHRSWMQPEWYSDQAAIRRHLRQRKQHDLVNAAQDTYAARHKPTEELYDTHSDPHQLVNLVRSHQHLDILNRMRRELRNWQHSTHDVGFLPEADVWSRLENDTPWHLGHDPQRYPLARIRKAAERVGRKAVDINQRLTDLTDSDAAVRFWGVLGLHELSLRSDELPADAIRAVQQRLSDASAPVRLAAAEMLLVTRDDQKSLKVLIDALRSDRVEEVLRAARALQLSGERARPALPQLKRLYQRALDRRSEHPNWLFVLFSVDAALARLEPHAQRDSLQL